MELSNIASVIPELFLACAGMSLLLYGVFRGDAAYKAVSWLTVVAFVVAASLVFLGEGRSTPFGGQFVTDEFARFMKCLVLVGSGLSVLMALSYNRREDMARCEYPVLILFATLGMFMMVSANDLISLYIGLELQSLSLYVLAAFRRDSVRSSEAGLKYFVLGALSSGMLLYGASLIYGFSGTTSFDSIQAVIVHSGSPSIGLIVGLIFLIAGLAFKVSAVPFHMWTPDVYEGAPTPVTAFFALAPKVAAVALFIRVMTEPFGAMIAEWQQVIVLISVASMVLGAVAAIWQTNIKRLLAYSSIGHIGYALIGLAAGSEEGVRGILIYMAIYLAMNIGTFCCVLSMRKGTAMVENISDLAGLSRHQPLVALALALLMFSMAGIPPLAGFFGKLYIFLAAVDSGLIVLAIIGVLASVIGAFYYLRIIKVMYFDDPVDELERPVSIELKIILTLSSGFVLLFFLAPGPIVQSASAAAKVLFAG